ncbi:MAG: hypothetical protein AB1630_08740 [bacterium]
MKRILSLVNVRVGVYKPGGKGSGFVFDLIFLIAKRLKLNVYLCLMASVKEGQ